MLCEPSSVCVAPPGTHTVCAMICGFGACRNRPIVIESVAIAPALSVTVSRSTTTPAALGATNDGVAVLAPVSEMVHGPSTVKHAVVVQLYAAIVPSGSRLAE